MTLSTITHWPPTRLVVLVALALVFGYQMAGADMDHDPTTVRIQHFDKDGNELFAPGVYPNPFNPNAAFEFSLPSGSWVDVDVVDVRGNRIRSLMSEMLPGGSYEVRWNGRDEAGRGVASGVYFARVRSSFGSRVTKMTLTK